MEEIMIKLAEMLEITVEAAVELYPVLRNQYIWYTAVDLVASPLVAIAVLSLGVAVYSLIRNIDSISDLKRYKLFNEDSDFNTWGDEIERAKRSIESSKRTLKVSSILLGATALPAIGLYIVRLLMAPDLHMLLHLMD